MKTIATKVKEKIFQLNIGNEVIFNEKIKGFLYGYKPTVHMGLIVLEDIDNNTPIYKNWEMLDTKILLTPLSKISDEDAKMCVSFLYPNKQIKDININDGGITLKWKGTYSYLSGIIYFNHLININVYQYLQSKGYALPYMDYSVEDLVELGIYKLK